MKQNLFIHENETLDDLLEGNLKILQKRDGYRFSNDSILLADFVGIPQGNSIVDLGTGCGILPILMAHKTQMKMIVGVEIQKDLAEMAKRSVALNNFSGRVIVIREDIRNIKDLFSAESFDNVLSNPPYRRVSSGRISPHPQKAIACNEIQCSIGDVLKISSYLLRPKGKVYLIFPALRLSDLMCELKESNLEVKKLQIVYSGADSEGKRVLVEASKDGGGGLKILKPLFVHDPHI